MNSFPRKLITEWRRLTLAVEGGTMIVACSGGADSCSLLLAVKELTDRKKLGHNIIAAHFDHGLRNESSDDAEFVRELCNTNGIEFVLGREHVSQRGNLEENARNARYSFLARTAQKHNAFAVLTGHTINDQAETFLLNLIRGSGSDGLSAMPPVRPLAKCDADLVRPLVRIATREETVEYCAGHGVEFRRDPMNEDPSFTRVRIRREVIPLLSELNPRIVATLARTAEHFAAVPPIAPLPEKLRSSDLVKVSEKERLALIRAWMIERRGSSRRLTFAHINAVDKLLTSTKSGRVVELPGGAVVERSGGWLSYRTE